MPLVLNSSALLPDLIAPHLGGVQIMAKVAVNGEDEHPLFALAKEAFPGEVTWNFNGIFVFDKEHPLPPPHIPYIYTGTFSTSHSDNSQHLGCPGTATLVVSNKSTCLPTYLPTYLRFTYLGGQLRAPLRLQAAQGGRRRHHGARLATQLLSARRGRVCPLPAAAASPHRL